MIEKIFEMLEAESDFFGGTPMGTLQKMYYCKGVEKAIQIVQEVAKEYGNGWIPCSERLPEEYVNVLGCDDNGHIYVVVMHTDYVFGRCWKQWNGGDWRFECIVAWQPLPAPYQKGE